MIQFTNPITAIATGVLAIGKGLIGYASDKLEFEKEKTIAKRNLELAKINAKAKLADQAHELQQGMMDADTAQILENRNTYFDEVVKFSVFFLPFYALYDYELVLKFIKIFNELPPIFQGVWLILVVTTLAGRGMFAPVTNLLSKKR